jgi:hypothetical protein
MKRRVNKPGYLRSLGRTRLEVSIWLFAVAFMITSGILLITDKVGHWVILVGGLIAAGLGLMRYRSEAAQKKRNADD